MNRTVLVALIAVSSLPLGTAAVAAPEAASSSTVTPAITALPIAAQIKTLADQIATQEGALALLKTRYAELHPKVISETNNLADLRQRLTAICPAGSDIVIAFAAQDVFERRQHVLESEIREALNRYSEASAKVAGPRQEIEAMRTRLAELWQAATTVGPGQPG